MSLHASTYDIGEGLVIAGIRCGHTPGCYPATITGSREVVARITALLDRDHRQAALSMTACEAPLQSTPDGGSGA